MSDAITVTDDLFSGTANGSQPWYQAIRRGFSSSLPALTAFGISLAAVCAAVARIGRDGLGAAFSQAPTDPLFWALFVLSYALLPLSEWVIFRRIWRLPVRGIGALLRKQVSNELVLGYSGEAQFYLWARKHASLKTSPFGAVKDVAMLSALAGNLSTLAMMLVTGPLLISAMNGAMGTTFIASVSLTILISLMIFVFRGKLFSLPRGTLVFILSVHFVRIAVSAMLIATLWSFLLPDAAMTSLVTLVTVRMMLSRLPLLPAKDIVFAGLVGVVLGSPAELVAALMLVGSLIVAGHVVVAIVGFVGDMAARTRRA